MIGTAISRFCEQVLAQGHEFIFVCLPGSHPLLYEWVADFARTGEVALLVKDPLDR
jgi:hypothetical protein